MQVASILKNVSLIIRNEEVEGVKYPLSVSIRKNIDPEIEILIPVHNGLTLTRLCIDCIRAFTTVPYRIWVIDDKSTDGTSEWLLNQKDCNVIKNIKGTTPHRGWFKKWWDIKYGGSTSNAVNLEIGRRFVEAKNVFVMHNDALPIRENWAQTFLSKMSEDVRGVSVRKDPIRVGAMHISGMLYDNSLFDPLGMSFMHDMPTYDAGDKISLTLQRAGYNCHYFKNTFNDPDLLLKKIFEGHWLRNIYCDRAIDDNLKPFYLHLGRGTLQANTNKTRKTTIQEWENVIRKNLLESQTSYSQA